MYAEFTDDLVTGNEMIDTQHKELICKINDLLKSCEERSTQSGAARMLNFLADYTEYHFNEEEALQESINYPGIKEHKEKHEELRRTVQELHERGRRPHRRIRGKGLRESQGLAVLPHPDL